MPKMDEIPEEFKNDKTEWNDIADHWFACGLPEGVSFYPKNGVDAEKAYTVIAATLGSYAPKHEHKTVAAAYMLSCWFEKVTGWKED